MPTFTTPPVMTTFPRAQASSAATPGARTSLGKDQFLQLFVKRLQNQDPLSPMQDGDFIAQMAQFSSLEQLTNMNENLQKALSGDGLLSQTISNTMATSLIGRTVRVESNSVILKDSGSADIGYDLDKAATDVTVEIKNSDGVLVRALRPGGKPEGAGQLSWDGNDTNGNRVAAGQYQVTIRAQDDKGEPVNVRAYFKGKVDSVRYVNGQALLAVGKALIPLGSVIEVTADN